MHQSFRPVEWSKKTNVYEVNTRQYTPEGTFSAFRKHIPRLKDMGVEVLWFMPVTPISQLNKKGSLGSYYACSDYTGVNPEFGTMEDFREVVNDAHKLGMKVIIDWVANHTGCDHKWTIEKPDFYKRDSKGHFYDAHGWDDVIDLNYENRELRLTLIDAMAWWINETDIDGFRCDMAMLTPVDFWLQARTALDPIKPLYWLAELDSWNNPEYMQVFDSAYTWKWMHVTREYIQANPRDINLLHSTLHHYVTIMPPTQLRAWFTSNHDENSWNGTEYEKYGVMAHPLAVFSCTWHGIPLIYSGQELPNHKRLQFFEKDPIEWKEQPALHEFYKKLLGLRATHPALISDENNFAVPLVKTSQSHHVFSYVRSAGDRSVFVLLNLSDHDFQELYIEDDSVSGSFSELFTGEGFNLTENKKIVLPAWSYKVLVS